MRFPFLLFPISIAAAQSVGVGMKGGVPFSGVFTATGSIGTEPFVASTQRFTIGPMLELRLPVGAGIEFDALYKRFDQTGGSIHSGTTVAKIGSSWEFPLLAKYRFGPSFANPYVEAGVSFNRLNGYLLPFRTFADSPFRSAGGVQHTDGFGSWYGYRVEVPHRANFPGYSLFTLGRSTFRSKYDHGGFSRRREFLNRTAWRVSIGLCAYKLQEPLSHSSHSTFDERL
jgi:hypothetical protein